MPIITISSYLPLYCIAAWHSRAHSCTASSCLFLPHRRTYCTTSSHHIVALHHRSYRCTASSHCIVVPIAVPHSCAYRYRIIMPIVVPHRHAAPSCPSLPHHRTYHCTASSHGIIVPIVVSHRCIALSYLFQNAANHYLYSTLALYICILFLPSTSRSWILLLPSIAPTYNGASIDSVPRFHMLS